LPGKDRTVQNAVVVHFQDGKIFKGTSLDFAPVRPSFHLQEEQGGNILEIQIADLKAVFFVKSFTGDPTYSDNPGAERAGFGKRIKVTFQDGESIIGYTSGYGASRPAFFVFPADERSNNEKIFVVASATADVEFL
jgi:hypothetical protein